MARHPRQLTSSPEAVRELETLLQETGIRRALRLRLKIVLLCLKGIKSADISKECGVSLPTVLRWRNRYAEGGAAALRDLPRAGRPSVGGSDAREKLLKAYRSDPPEGKDHWTCTDLSQETGFPKQLIWRLLRAEGIRLERRHSSSIPPRATGPRACELTGVYLAPPDLALVLRTTPAGRAGARHSAGWKIQLRTACPDLGQRLRDAGQPSPAEACRLAAEWFREGGKEPVIEGPRKTVDNFLDELLAVLPAGGSFHVLLRSRTLPQRLQDWQKSHPEFSFHCVDQESWIKMADLCIDMFRPGDPEGVSDALSAFGEAFTRAGARHPLLWCRCPDGSGEADASAGAADGETPAPQASPEA